MKETVLIAYTMGDESVGMQGASTTITIADFDGFPVHIQNEIRMALEGVLTEAWDDKAYVVPEEWLKEEAQEPDWIDPPFDAYMPDPPKPRDIDDMEFDDFWFDADRERRLFRR